VCWPSLEFAAFLQGGAVFIPGSPTPRPRTSHPSCTTTGSNGLPFDPTDPQGAATAITRTTGGNFRLIERLMSQIARVLDINQLDVITAEVVDAARQTLVVGPQ